MNELDIQRPQTWLEHRSNVTPLELEMCSTPGVFYAYYLGLGRTKPAPAKLTVGAVQIIESVDQENLKAMIAELKIQPVCRERKEKSGEFSVQHVYRDSDLERAFLAAIKAAVFPEVV
jgi:hypothetical protein